MLHLSGVNILHFNVINNHIYYHYSLWRFQPPSPRACTFMRAHTHKHIQYVHTVNDIDYNSHHSLQSKSHDLGPNAIMGSVPLPAVCFSQLLLLLHAVFKSMFIKVLSVLERLCRFVTVFKWI